jgi:MFS family permease
VHTADFLGNFQTGAADAINRIFGVGGGGLMTVGQMSEIIVLAAIPLIAKKVSRKTLLLSGIVAYTLRMFLFAYVQQIHEATGIPEVAILIAGVALHGFCFGCFIFVAFMIVDEETTGDVKASAQSLFNVVIVGVGIIVGSKIATGVADWVKDDGGAINYQQLFSVPMWASLACLVILLVFYPGGRRASRSSPPSPPADRGPPEAT